MRIGELSERTGVAAHQLRYYESKGLLEPKRAGNGYREYDDDSVLRVAQIRRLLEAGLSTDDISYVQPCVSGEAPELEPCDELLTTLQARLAELDERIGDLSRSRQALNEFIAAAERRR
ncbi:MerR family transcriptional regulator [Phytoactinopolyspora halotolerans]|uniref:MerR family transcriptional regulator n=1 Tax=Phytoactinopolyspora halotolerans TaxID=1981512 RepID=A0A6L9S1L3_9ACTN|nr:MerR family transcriptional regulator [Phytoactinopolyspora halotolerans]